MPPKKPNLKPTPSLVAVRLELTVAERDQLRVIAAKSPQRTMAVWCREMIRKAMQEAER